MLIKIVLSKADRAEVEEYQEKTRILMEPQVRAKAKAFVDNARWWNAERRKAQKKEKGGSTCQK